MGCYRRFWCTCLSSPVNHSQVRGSPLCSSCWCVQHVFPPAPARLFAPVSPAALPRVALSQLSPPQEWHHLLGGAGVRSPRHAGPHLPSTSQRASSAGDLRNTSGRLLLILNVSLSSSSAANQLPHAWHGLWMGSTGNEGCQAGAGQEAPSCSSTGSPAGCSALRCEPRPHFQGAAACCALTGACLLPGSACLSPLWPLCLRREQNPAVCRGWHCPAEDLSLLAAPDPGQRNAAGVVPGAGAGL